jgi:hypothetical protein
MEQNKEKKASGGVLAASIHVDMIDFDHCPVILVLSLINL